MTSVRAAVQLLVFPGLLYAFAAAFLMEWLQRKINARLQGRIGPPFYQPFFDVVKLLGKRSVERPPLQGLMMTALPTAAVVATLGAATLLPVVPTSGGFDGDLILLVGLIELGPLLVVLGGYVSQSLWGGLGASREAIMTATYNLPFLTALAALAYSSGLSLNGMALTAGWPVRTLALIAILICLPAKLHLNPFSIASAEQEIYAGATTEYDGPRLALWELAHGLEWVALVGLVAALSLPVDGLGWPVRVLVFLMLSLVVVVLLSVAAAATARLKLAQTARWFWLWGLVPAGSALVLAFAGF
ncbi:respiratory chain complex I subunit 1 family protein [Streptomyces sp. YIM S03343]